VVAVDFGKVPNNNDIISLLLMIIGHFDSNKDSSYQKVR
jgi:hypothetical protein